MMIARIETFPLHIPFKIRQPSCSLSLGGLRFAATANGLEDVSKMPALIAVLMKRGYAEGDLKKILGENFLRVVREVVGE